MLQSKILFQMSGSIACYKSCNLISKWVQAGHEVQVVATQAALNFIGKASLEGLTGKPVVSDIFQPGHIMDHIQLARWCDWAILCPASAHTVNNLAAGLASDLIGALFLAFELGKKPYWLAPAMNSKMHEHPATQAALERLRHWGVRVLASGEGALACGEWGEGRMMEPELIDQTISQARRSSTRPRRVLVTAGATREAIDSVRCLTNFSTGATGAAIADTFAQSGHDVCFLHGANAILPTGRTHKIPFTSYSDLREQLQKCLSSEDYDVVLHAAAVSDFAITEVRTQSGTQPTKNFKLSSHESVQITLSPVPKHIASLREFSRNKKLKIVAFKLTSHLNSEQQRRAVQSLFSQNEVDYVVHNDLAGIQSEQGIHNASIYSNQHCLQSCSSKLELAHALENIVIHN